MKKSVLVLLLFAVVIVSAFGWQENFRYSSKEFQVLQLLGNLTKTQFGAVQMPVSSAEMLDMLNEINTEKLGDYGRELYQWLENRLSNPKVMFKVSDFGLYAKLKVGSDLYLHTNKGNSDFTTCVQYKDKPSLFEGDFGIYVSENVFGKFNLSVRKAADGSVLFENGFRDLISDVGSYSQVLPSWAYLSLGNNLLNLTIGRDRLSSGKGFTGNLLLSENQDYNDFVKFSIFKNPVSYDFTLIAFSGFKYDDVYSKSTREEYFTDSTSLDNKLAWPNFNSPVKNMLIHRATFTVKNTVDIALYEGAVFYGQIAKNIISASNPMMIFHNTGSYYSGNTNNFFGVEVSSSLPEGWSFDFQVLLDQIQLKRESHGEDEAPDAMGILANISKTTEFGKGILQVWAEGVYTTEGLYLKEKKNNYPMHFDYQDYTKPLYYYYLEDMISGYINFTNSDEFSYIGYKLGSDVKVLAVGAEFLADKFTLDASVLFSDKGHYGIGVNETRYLTEKDNGRKNQLSLTANLCGKFSIIKGFDVNASITCFSAQNYQHTEKNMFDVQMFVGAVFQVDELLNRNSL